jgi:CO/xanthine dehydrogenase FAD-binding subunit
MGQQGDVFMSLPDLKAFCLPTENQEVAQLLDQYGDSALFVSGGTFIHGLEARGLLAGVEALIDLRNLGLDKVEPEKGGVRAGATVTFADLEQLPSIDSPAFGALRDALDLPPAQIKNLATVGGSIAASCPFFDVPAAFQVLDAMVTISSGRKSRTVDFTNVYAGLFQNTLAPNEYIESLFIPKQSKHTASAYLKLETNANDLALVGVAVRIGLDWRHRLTESRIVLGGGLHSTFVRSAAAEAALDGDKPGEELFADAAEAILGDIEPISDHRCSAEYRTEIGKVFVRRALQRAMERLQ